jgi:hypothetical protein
MSQDPKVRRKMLSEAQKELKTADKLIEDAIKKYEELDIDPKSAKKTPRQRVDQTAQKRKEMREHFLKYKEEQRQRRERRRAKEQKKAAVSEAPAPSPTPAPKVSPVVSAQETAVPSVPAPMVSPEPVTATANVTAEAPKDTGGMSGLFSRLFGSTPSPTPAPVPVPTGNKISDSNDLPELTNQYSAQVSVQPQPHSGGRKRANTK